MMDFPSRRLLAACCLAVCVTGLLSSPAPAADPASIEAAARHFEPNRQIPLQYGSLDLFREMSDADWRQLRVLKDVPKLKHLSFSANSITDDDLIHLKDFVWLESFSIYDRNEIAKPRVHGPGLVHLSRLPRLRSLGFFGDWFGDEIVPPLKEFPHLTRLYLLGGHASASVMHVIGEMQNLEELHLRLKIADDSLKELRSLQMLRVLHLSFLGVTLVGPGDSVRLSHIHWRKPITDSALQHVAALRSLHSLRISGAAISSVGPLHQLPDLEELDLSGEMTSYGLSALGEFPALRRLNLGTRQIDEEQLKLISRASRLESLYLNAKVADAGLFHLAQLPRLKLLRLYNTGVTDAGIVDLQYVRALESLDLDSTGLGDEGMAALAELPRLKTLDAQRTGITNGCVPSLEKMAALQHFNPIETGFSTDAYVALRRLRPELRIAVDAPP